MRDDLRRKARRLLLLCVQHRLGGIELSFAGRELRDQTIDVADRGLLVLVVECGGLRRGREHRRQLTRRCVVDVGVHRRDLELVVGSGVLLAGDSESRIGSRQLRVDLLEMHIGLVVLFGQRARDCCCVANAASTASTCAWVASIAAPVAACPVPPRVGLGEPAAGTAAAEPTTTIAAMRMATPGLRSASRRDETDLSQQSL